MATLVAAVSLLVCGADIPDRQLADPAWWSSRAKSEQQSIADPDERDLTGQMIAPMLEWLAAGKPLLGDSKDASQQSGADPTNPTTFEDLAAAQVQTGQLDAALVSVSQITPEGIGSAGRAGELALKFAERGDWRGARRAMRLVKRDESSIYCLIQMAEFADRSGSAMQIAPLLAEGSRRLAALEDIRSQERNCEYLALAYVAIGDAQAAWEIVEQFGSDFEKATVLVSMAQRQLDRKDVAGFTHSMQRLTAVVTRDRLHVFRSDPPDLVSTTWRRERQIYFSFLAGRLYLRAGDRAQAKAAIHAGFDRAGSTPGIDWRADLYLGMLPGGDVTTLAPLNLQEAADLLECVPTPIDRAMLAIVGGTIAAMEQQRQLPGPP